MTKLQTSHFEKPLHVWVPENYDAAKPHPTLFYYHGTSGQPTIEYLRLYTKGKDWVLIGMTYIEPGQYQFSAENLERDIKILHEVRETVAQSVNLDPKRIFVSGFSKGGWVTALILEKDPKVAGGMILGAGIFEPTTGAHPKKIYIGIGEDDPNLAMSIAAKNAFSKNRASEVTFEIWPGIGHKFPLLGIEPSSDSMKQWLRVQAGIANQSDAIDWMEDTLAETKKSPDLSAFEKLETIESMQASPYAALLDKEGKETLADALAEFRADPRTEREQEARAQFKKILAYESKDRFVSTIAECAAQYHKIAEAFPKTKYGRLAGKAVERISGILKNTNK
ncbi:MAG: hypothetical protein HKN23_12535 [Verrucomicrobiales bacterium]|nr:hypothetical protein [Verrucomicrobiales bacterium]